MRSKEKLWDICMNIYRDMYIYSTPPADFDNLISSGVTKQPMWFMDYVIDINKSKEILDQHYQKNKLTRYEQRRVSCEIFLGCSPKFK